MSNIRVRFHLGNGPYKGYWQVKTGDRVVYVNPAENSLVMLDCQLCNQPATALKIHKGSNKSVCAWVSCKTASVIHTGKTPTVSGLTDDRVVFCPRIAPHWVDYWGNNLDKKRYTTLITHHRSIYVKGQELRH